MDSIWIDLLNSDWRDYRGSGRSEDRLGNTEWLRSFLTRWDWALPQTATAEAGAALRELRSLLQRIVDAMASGRPVSRKDWRSLNGLMARALLFRQLKISAEADYQLEYVPLEKNIDNLVAEIAFSFADVIAHGDPTRIKVCENPDCRWVYYDKSKNRTRRWCEDSACGNLMKVRRFRARQKKKK